MEGCAGKPSSIWRGVERRKLTAVQVGKEVVVIAQVQSSSSEVGTWMEELKYLKCGCTLVWHTEPAQLKVVRVCLFCSILSTLRLPRSLVVLYML